MASWGPHRDRPDQGQRPRVEGMAPVQERGRVLGLSRMDADRNVVQLGLDEDQADDL